MPSLLEALEKLTQDKPDDPIQYIGEYLLREEDRMQLDKWSINTTNLYKRKSHNFTIINFGRTSHWDKQ